MSDAHTTLEVTDSSDPACAVSLQTQFEYDSYPYQTTHSDARCVVSVRAQDRELARAPIDLCAVIDRSGSMRGSKLDLVKQAVKFMIQQLSGTDRLSVVSFDAQVQDTYGDSCNMNYMTSGNKKVATACIDRLQAGGGTNLSAGLFRAIDHHQQQPLTSSSTASHQTRVKSVFLFSDGISSVGVTERTQLMAILTAMLQKTGSPNIFTFGFGGVYDYRIMNGISEEGKGHCMHIQDVEVIPAAFATALGSLMSVASQNFELTLAPEEGVTIKHVDTSFKKTPLPDGSLVIGIGDLYAGEQKDILVKLDFPQLLISTQCMPVLSLEARYVAISNTCMETTQLAVTIARTTTLLGSQPRHLSVLQNAQRCETSSALQAASDMAARGDLSGARALLASMEAAVRQHPVNALSASYANDLRITLDAFESHESYQRVGRVVSSSIAHEHSRQQTSFVGSGRTPMYQSSNGHRLYGLSTVVNSETSESSDSKDLQGDAEASHPTHSPDKPTEDMGMRIRVRVPAKSNRDSTTSTVDYQHQVAVSSRLKRKHGQMSTDPTSQPPREETEEAGHTTQRKVYKDKQ